MPKLEGGRKSLWEMSALIPGRGPGEYSGHHTLESQELLQSTMLLVWPNQLSCSPLSRSVPPV